MNAPVKLAALDAGHPGLAKLRAPFAENQISKLPKESKAQREARQTDRSQGVSCPVCGGWHHRSAVHLDYVGHAALTDRLLDADPFWTWEPVAFAPTGLPLFDQTGGLWIRLTVCGLTRLGYGHAAPKPNQDAGAREKEVIGDALRNAAMRFGAALDFWHKGDLHADGPDGETATPLWITAAEAAITCLATPEACGDWYRANLSELKARPQAERDRVLHYLKERKHALTPSAPADPPQTYAQARGGGERRAPPAPTPEIGPGRETPFDDDLSVLDGDEIPF